VAPTDYEQAVAFAAECGGEHTEREAHACQAPAFDQLPK
jgi:hypothetical protein